MLDFAGYLGICSQWVCLAEYLEGVDLPFTVIYRFRDLDFRSAAA